MTFGVERDDQQRRRRAASSTTPLLNTSRSPRRAQLPGQVAVAGEQRGQHREAVVGGVRGEDEDRRGERLQGVEGRPGAEDGQPDLAERRLLRLPGRQADQQRRVLGHVHVRDHGQRGDAGEHGDGQRAHDRERGGGVAGLGRLEARDAVADRLHPGQRGAAAGEGPQREEDGEQPAGAVVGERGRSRRSRRSGSGPSASRTPATASRSRTIATKP